MFLETVWSRLEEERWTSAQELKESSGLDETTLIRAIDFLVRWNFAEKRHRNVLEVRRMAGAMSPVHVLGLLESVSMGRSGSQVVRKGRLAERVSCRICGERSLTPIGQNMVECRRCHERQWCTIDVGTRRLLKDGIPAVERPGWLRRLRGH